MTYRLPYVYSMIGNYAFLSANQSWQSIKWGQSKKSGQIPTKLYCKGS